MLLIASQSLEIPIWMLFHSCDDIRYDCIDDGSVRYSYHNILYHQKIYVHSKDILFEFNVIY